MASREIIGFTIGPEMSRRILAGDARRERAHRAMTSLHVREFRVFLENGPNSVPIAPIERLLHCRCRCARAMRPIDPSLGITLRKIHGMTCGTGSDAERVVVHPATPSFGKSHPGGLYAA